MDEIVMFQFVMSFCFGAVFMLAVVAFSTLIFLNLKLYCKREFG